MPTPKLIELDESVTVQQQSNLEVGPAVLINTFHVNPTKWTASSRRGRRRRPT